MQMSNQQIDVSIELGGETHKVGKLWFHQRGARQSVSFEYDPDWLKHSEKFVLLSGRPLRVPLQKTRGLKQPNGVWNQSWTSR